MELTLNIYGDRFCRKHIRTVTANTFDLSTAICSDVIEIVNLDMFEGGISSLTNESTVEMIAGIVKNGFPFFVELMQELFELTDEEIRYTKIEEIVAIVVEIVKYSVKTLKSSLVGKKAKN